MIRVLICCGGGFSSSAMAEKAKKDIIEKGLEDQISIDFSPFSMAARDFGDCDILMLCPHLKHYVKEYNEKYIHNKIPAYILPPKMYGTMNMEEVYQDAKDLIEIFKENPQNPCHFPGEDNPLKIKRSESFATYNKKS